MKLKRGEAITVYIDADSGIVERPDMLAQVQGRSLTDAKKIVSKHRKTVMYAWFDREGNEVGRSFGSNVVSMEIKPANAEERKLDYLRRLREALSRVSKPDATQQDVAEALALQIEYQEFLAQLED